MAVIQLNAISAIRQDFLNHALHLNKIFFCH